MIMLFAIIHELGHLVAGILLGMHAEKIEIKPFGVAIDLNIKRKDYMVKLRRGNILEVKKIIVALAGPLTNAFIILILSAPPIFRLNPEETIVMIFSNITLILFNILPIYPLDGGRIIKSMMYIVKGKQRAEKYTYYISYITLVVITMISSIAILYLKNIAIFLVVIVLWGLQMKEQKIYRNKMTLYEIIEKEMKKDECKNIKIPIENKIN